MAEHNPDDIFNQEGDSKTAFNSALDIIKRISILEYALTTCFVYDDLKGAYKLLVLIYTEIDFKLTDPQRKELSKLENELRDKVVKAEMKYNYNGNIFIKYPSLRQQTILDLLEFKKQISRLKYKVGLGMIDMSDPKFALMNG